MTETDRRKVLQAALAAVSGPSLLSLARADEPQAPAKKIKIGQIGTGHAHASGKLDAIRELADRFELVGVVENDPARRAALGGEYRGVKLISEEQLFNTPGLQAVAVETEVPDLVPAAERCVRAGVHVHLDKPPGESLPAYRRLLESSSQRRLVVQMGYIYRYHPAIRLCAQAIRDGWLGDVFEIDTVISKTISDDSRRRLARFPGGAMFELGCHVVDVVVWLLGKPEAVTPFVRRTQPDKDNLADNQLAVLEYPRATATVRSALVEVLGQDRRQLVVCGDRGTFDLRPLSGGKFELTLDRPRGRYQKGRRQITLPGKVRRYIGDFVELAAVIRGEKAADFSPEHDLAVHAAVLRAADIACEVGRAGECAPRWP